MKLKYFKIQLVITITALSLAASVFAANHDYNRNYGEIGRLYPATNGSLCFKLINGVTAMNPSTGYYYIPASCTNCNDMRDTIRLATEHRWKVQARTDLTLDANGSAKVVYLVVDFDAGTPPSN